VFRGVLDLVVCLHLEFYSVTSLFWSVALCFVWCTIANHVLVVKLCTPFCAQKPAPYLIGSTSSAGNRQLRRAASKCLQPSVLVY